MKLSFALGGVCAVALSAAPALADEETPTVVYTAESPPVQPPPPAAPQAAPMAPMSPQVVVVQEPPAAAAGEWVYTAESGYIWVPAGTTTQVIEGVPSAYFYTPAYGWTWYASPWGAGAFAYGPWVAQPWPYGVRAWSRGPSGWGWRAGGVGIRGTGGYYGAAGHYYGPGGARYATHAGHWSGGRGVAGHFGRR
jgi:hypothetical protein